jgi:hypothetical protein
MRFTFRRSLHTGNSPASICLLPCDSTGEEEDMTAYTRTDRRLLGFDMGDWSILSVGLALVALLTLLV